MEFCTLTPNLMVEDVNGTIRYYREILGFSLRMAVDIPALVNHSISASVSLYITVTDIEKLYGELLVKTDCIKELETTWYNMREFYIRDMNGYILGFAEQLS